jgi:hypothetical protein
MIRAALAVLVLLCAPCAFAQAPHPFAGTWTGEGETFGTTDRFAMVVEIAPDGSARIDYRGLVGGYRCAAVWVRQDERRNDYREQILSGECEDGGAVRLVRRKAGLEMIWSKKVGGTTIRAKALLRAPALTS